MLQLAPINADIAQAVTEKLKYLDPKPDKDARFTESAGLTRLQLEDWCNAATVESDCSIPGLEYLTADNATNVANDINDRMKFRWLGCEWRRDTQKCVYRTVPLCHLWDLVYPESFGADRPLQNCQPYEGKTPVWPLDGSGNTATTGFSPCVVIQQIYKEPQEGKNKMLPIPGTSMYLTSHKPLEDYENLLCVPLVTKIEVRLSSVCCEGGRGLTFSFAGEQFKLQRLAQVGSTSPGAEWGELRRSVECGQSRLRRGKMAEREEILSVKLIAICRSVPGILALFRGRPLGRNWQTESTTQQISTSKPCFSRSCLLSSFLTRSLPSWKPP